MKKKLCLLTIGLCILTLLTGCENPNNNDLDSSKNNVNDNNTNSEVQNNQESNETKSEKMILKVDKRDIEIVIYDTEVGRNIKSRLPYRATVSNGGVDLCGDAGKDIKFSDAESTRKSNAGDIMYIKNGNYFSIFLIDYDNQNDAFKIGEIVNEEDIDYLKNNISTATVEIIK